MSGNGAWLSRGDLIGDWIQAEFNSTKTVLGIQTQSRYGFNHLVKSYIVSYSLDGQEWIILSGTDGLPKV